MSWFSNWFGDIGNVLGSVGSDISNAIGTVATDIGSDVAQPVGSALHLDSPIVQAALDAAGTYGFGAGAGASTLGVDTGLSAATDASLAQGAAQVSGDLAAAGFGAGTTDAALAADLGTNATFDTSLLGSAAADAGSSSLPEILVQSGPTATPALSGSPNLAGFLLPMGALGATQALAAGMAAPQGVAPGLQEGGDGGAAAVPGVASPAAALGGADLPTADFGFGDVGGISLTNDPAAADSSNPWWKFLTTPKGAIGAGLLGSNLYGLLNKPKLPGAAQSALNAAGPAVSQAQSIIQTGGMGSPIWSTQKAAIDAQVDQEIKNMTSAILQTSINSGMGGSNSAAAQEQIATLTDKMNAQRQTLYDQALQMNVNNAVSELTGANQTLMAVAQLQMEQDQWAQQLARDIGLTTGELFALTGQVMHA